jgi:hypothetical protein
MYGASSMIDGVLGFASVIDRENCGGRDGCEGASLKSLLLSMAEAGCELDVSGRERTLRSLSAMDWKLQSKVGMSASGAVFGGGSTWSRSSCMRSRDRTVRSSDESSRQVTSS